MKKRKDKLARMCYNYFKGNHMIVLPESKEPYQNLIPQKFCEIGKNKKISASITYTGNTLKDNW